MRLLNTKSILDCNEEELSKHYDEINNIKDEINKLENYDCAVIFKKIDIAHKSQNQIIKTCSLHDFMEMVEYTDFKNGIDFAVDENDIFIVVVYGQGYELDGFYNFIETHIHIMPYDDNRKFINIVEML